MNNPFSRVLTKDLPNFNSLFGNLGKSWTNPLPNDLHIKGLPKVIERNFARVNSVGAGPDVLHTYTLPAGTVKANDLIEIAYSGGFAANNTDKFVQAQFGGVSYEPGGALDIDALGWFICTRIGIVDSTHVNIGHFITMGTFHINSDNVTITAFNIGGLTIVRNADNQVVPDMSSNATVIRVRSVAGVGAAVSDIYQNISEIKLTRF